MNRTPAPLNDTVSAQMRRMPRERTGPELRLRRELHRRGMRFRVNRKDLPGRPDITFSRARLAVFVDGCFWHMCPSHSTMPKNNAEWWRAKLERNVERDREKDELLVSQGWHVLHVWEHDDTGVVADRIQALWLSLRAARPTGSDGHVTDLGSSVASWSSPTT
ncbi:very short patch repair endonuclease [Plantactinospora endophytica]|uniref:Very short patch repair endonuclease n=1 Tax=Plantactinospora endophytica TaxID=673535 RepID=A0ABQ4E8T8_9ACTN|nr:very short patch repair endonuclease [Plantactinospora endophytica]GIG91118.1 very short patch repair endonuclease [Plantactinospora endophytica]